MSATIQHHHNLDSDELEALPWHHDPSPASPMHISSATSTAATMMSGTNPATTHTAHWAMSRTSTTAITRIRTAPVTMLRGPQTSSSTPTVHHPMGFQPSRSGSQRVTPTTPFEGEMLDFSPGLTNGTTSERSSSSSLGWTSASTTDSASRWGSGYDHFEGMPQSPNNYGQHQQQVLLSVAATPQATDPHYRHRHTTRSSQPSPTTVSRPDLEELVMEMPQDLIAPPQQQQQQQPLDPRIVTAQYHNFRWSNKENDRLVRNLKLQRQKHEEEDTAEWSRRFHDDWLGRTPSPW